MDIKIRTQEFQNANCKYFYAYIYIGLYELCIHISNVIIRYCITILVHIYKYHNETHLPVNEYVSE